MNDTFDNDLFNYLSKLAQDDMDAEANAKESLECEDWKLSNCCAAPIIENTDVCSECKEHCGRGCELCEIYDDCINKNRYEEN